MPPISRHDVSSAMAQLVPRIIQGVQLDFFITRRVTQTQCLVLMAIHASGSCTIGTLARSLHVSMPTASGIVERLVRAGYARRHPKPEDRRQVAVELTARGQSFIQQFQAVIRRRWDEVLRPLAPKELETFHRVITTLHTRLQPPR